MPPERTPTIGRGQHPRRLEQVLTEGEEVMLMDTEIRERHAAGRTDAWVRYVASEREELEKRKVGLVGRLLGRPLPSESGEDLRRFAEEDRERAVRGLVQLRLGDSVWWKPLHELTPEDRPARLEAQRVFASWLSDRRTARPVATSVGTHWVLDLAGRCS